MDTIDIKKLEHSEIEITGEIPAAEFEGFREKATKKLGEHLSLDGFRPGHIPEAIIRKTIGEAPILEEMAEMAIAALYPKLLEAKNLEAIGRPEVSITKLAAGNPLGFTIKTAILPEIALSDYKAVAKKVMGKEESVEVTDKDVDDTIAELRKNWARRETHGKLHAEGAEQTVHEDVPDDKLELPEVNDEFVKKLGKFENVDAFKVKLRENLKEEKVSKAHQARRAEVIDELLKQTPIDVPAVLVTSEQNKMFLQFKDNIGMMGIDPEDYMKQVNKTEESIKEEMKDESVRRAKTQLILNKVAQVEKVQVPLEEIRDEVNKLLQYYKGADPERAHLYVDQLLTNEKVFQFFEAQK